MKIAVSGSAGLLGSNICYLLREEHNIVGLFNRARPPVPLREKVEVDLTVENEVKSVITEIDPDVIIHCAGITNVEKCEEDYNLARDVNAIGTLNLVSSARKECKFVYISTDALFDGEKEGNYTEEDVTNPINNYAKTKLEGERFVEVHSENFLIVRTNFFGFAPAGRVGFIQWIIRELKAGRPINMVSDWYYSPILANDLIGVIVQLIESDSVGIFNITSSDSCSKYEFGIAVADEMDLDASLIKRVSMDNLKLVALRQKNMSMDVSKTEQTINKKLPRYKESITRFHGLLKSGYARGILTI